MKSSKHKQRGYYKIVPSGKEIIGIIIGLIIIGGSIPYVLVPWLWEHIKPWLHAITG